METEKVYIGTKIVKAIPQTRAEFVNEKSDGAEKISVEDDAPGYKVTYEDGYISWSPKDTFERSYRELTSNEGTLARSV